MSRRRSRRRDLIRGADASLLDLVDHLFTKGVVISGDVLLGLADVDLVYVRLSALICAADRLWPGSHGPRRPGPRLGPRS